MMRPDQIEKIRNSILLAGEKILQFQTDKNYQIKYKRPNDPVTTADDVANQIIVEAIESVFPGDVVVSEETYNDDTKTRINLERKNSKRVWFVDPLDGTKDFIKGLPHFAVSVGFFENDRPEIGFIYNPAKKFFFHGGQNYGTFFNNRPFTRPQGQATSMESLKICISTSEVKQNLFTDLMKSLPEDNIEFIGSVAYKLGLVASGEFDLILSKRGKYDWDIAAGIALLQNPDFEILDQHFNPVQLNQETLLTDGLVIGSKTAVDLYRNFLAG